MEDADEAVAECSERLVVEVSGVSSLVVELVASRTLFVGSRRPIGRLRRRAAGCGHGGRGLLSFFLMRR